MREVLMAYQNAVAGEIARMEGHLAKFVGDGVLAYFGFPKAHEDDAERAVRAGLAIVKSVKSVSTPDGQALAVRIGIATGLAVVGDTIGTGSSLERSVVGETPNLAGRLQGIAAPDQIVISSATRRLIADVFRLDDLGHLNLKGFDSGVHAYTVLSEGEAESRFDARQSGDFGPMVGRDQELSLLLDRWRMAKAGEGQMVLLLGEAGIGKSRLTRAIIDEVASETHHRLVYQCSPYHTDNALYPIAQRLASSARLERDDKPEVALDKLERVLALGLDDVRPAAGLLAPLLGLAGERRYGKTELPSSQLQLRTLEVLASHIIGLSRQRPVLLVFEDVHWIDPTSLELLDICLDSIAKAPVFLVVTARPTFEHKFGGHPIVTRLSLNRLGRDQIRAIAHRITLGKTLPGDVIQLIAARTDGIPLFVEELTKTIFESGALREVGSTLVLDQPFTEAVVPASLHDSLMARLDRHPGLKEVAQTAACIGREFGYPLLAAVSGTPEKALQEGLKLLASAELVFPRGTPPDATYVFKHALVRDAAYESLLKTQRRQIHAVIADTLVKHYADMIAISPEVVARHFIEAGLTEPAIEWATRAGMQAFKRSANLESVPSFRNALGLIESLCNKDKYRDLELEILMTLGTVLSTVKGYGDPETLNIYDRALDQCRKSGNARATMNILFGLWTSYVAMSNFRESWKIALETKHVADESNDKTLISCSIYIFSYEHLARGNFEESYNMFLDLKKFYVEERDGEFCFALTEHCGGLINVYLGLLKFYVGFHDDVLLLMELSINKLKELRHSNSVMVAMFFYCCTLKELGHYESCLLASNQLIQFGSDNDVPMWKRTGAILKGLALCHLGSVEEGIKIIRLGIKDYFNGPEAVQGPQFFSYLAEACLLTQNIEEGLEATSEGLRRAAETEEDYFTAELCRIKGELLLALERDKMPAIEELFERALEIARKQHSRTFELRAAMGLARLWAERGERARARNLLAPIYKWFKEDLDTGDLIEARTLLTQID